MHIQIDEPRRAHVQLNTGFFDYLASRRGFDRRIRRIDVTAGLEPAIETSVMHEQQRIATRAHHEAGSGEVPGIEVISRQRIPRHRRELEKAGRGGVAFVGPKQCHELRQPRVAGAWVLGGGFTHLASIFAQSDTRTTTDVRGRFGAMKVGIVGAGVFGASAARSLAGRGVDVTLFERRRVPTEDASGTDISKAIRYEYGDATRRYAPLVIESMDAWRALEIDTGRRLYHESGALFLSRSLDDDGFESVSARALEALGERVELVDQIDGARRWPAFDWTNLQGGLFSRRGGWLAAAEAVTALVQQAVTAGVSLHEETPVTAVGEGLIETNGTTHRFDAVLVCAGAWMTRLLPRIPAQVTRQFITHYRPSALPELPVWVHDISNADDAGAWYGFPESNGIVKVAHHDRGAAVDPDVERIAPEEFLTESRAFVTSLIPALAEAPVESRACLYTNSPNGDIVIDQVGPGLFVAGCGSGHGFKIGPAVGARAARLILDGETEFPQVFEESVVW